MQSASISGYIFLGLHWRYLQDAQEGYTIHGRGLVLENLDAVLKCLEKYSLQVTLRASQDLFILRQEFSAVGATAKLSADQAQRLRSAMYNLQQTLHAECAGNITYTVTDKRLDTRKLLENCAGLFAPGVFDKLPEIAQTDFREAGLCIAFERATAAAFHALRGTEDVLRSYYQKRVKQKRVSPLLWGPITQHLARKRNPPPVELLRNLDNIRLSFRNPTQHPEKSYDIHEAQDLLALCIDVVNRMVR